MKLVSMSTPVKVIFFLAIVSVVDLFLTTYFRHDPYFYELNPLIRPMLENDEILRLSVYKILVDLFGCMCIYYGLEENTKLIRILVYGIAIPVHVLLMCNWAFWLIARSVI